MFENKEWEGIHYSRFIASWMNVGGVIKRNGDEFRSWLMQMTINGKHMPEQVAWDIYNLAANGKLELESNARIYLKAKNIK